jgi:hypothetical protein
MSRHLIAKSATKEPLAWGNSLQREYHVRERLLLVLKVKEKRIWNSNCVQHPNARFKLPNHDTKRANAFAEKKMSAGYEYLMFRVWI